MADNSPGNTLKDLRVALEAMPIGEVRKRAVQNFGIKLSREWSKDDIINQIVGMSQKADYAVARGEGVDPGWARIKVHPVPGKPTWPFYVNCNGYECWIPFNVPVDVPIKVLGVLNDAQELRISANEDGQRVDSLEASYPYSIIQEVPGPDPRPGNEVAREARLKAKKAFYAREGYWPTDKVFKEFRDRGYHRDTEE